ncbi:MAG: hypothetical protein JXK07_08340 [Spirochaetes bacterium]|nr:hypothetical protein [Spirochaetota bacterium]MBN2772507.1 hypothetical protein [Spirochaetota bacterium]HRX16308.1 hypothetical protein [Spirochaetota bacterium]
MARIIDFIAFKLEKELKDEGFEVKMDHDKRIKLLLKFTGLKRKIR